ncbi:MAG: lactate permease LctP family transporter [Alphaproteobacteria bacterium]|uniref:L-lactate permease n=1 Tax=Candidatus Nitrobium versatile TaxID=2884831 RepID=A0A953J9W9_9BACT|nr:lactate permease LctP family transporter [Candidatus Nitrobium versatile]
MPWNMVTDPLHNTFLSALLALFPVAVLFWALAVRRMKGHVAALTVVGATLLTAVFGFGMPFIPALMSLVYGMLFGLFPITWIVVTAVFLFSITVRTKRIEVVKSSIASLTGDRRLQAIIIAFSFGSFLEGAAGFGAPVAISSAMLIGLGFAPLQAAGICLLANTAPVAFGAIGIPIIVAGQVSGVSTMAISGLVGLNLLFLSAVIPFYIVALMDGWKGVKEVWPALLVCGLSFGISQWWTAARLGPFLPDIIASLVSLTLLAGLLKFWKPRTSGQFSHEATDSGRESPRYTGGQVFSAWAPFMILTLLVAAWGIPSVRQTLDSLATVRAEMPGLHNRVVQDGVPLPAVFTFNYPGAAGTAILLAGIASLLMLRVPFSEGAAIFLRTIKTMRFPIITISSVLGFAYLSNFSGISVALGNAFAGTGPLFPFFSPLIGWLGVFITGSDTSANALFGKLQEVTALQLGMNPVITVAANSTGGVAAKMISPQSIAVATAAVGLAGHEGDIFRFTLKHSLFLALAIGIMTLLQAYVFAWVVPPYDAGGTAVAAQGVPGGASHSPEGAAYLGIMAVLIALIVFLGRRAGERPRQ